MTISNSIQIKRIFNVSKMPEDLFFYILYLFNSRMLKQICKQSRIIRTDNLFFSFFLVIMIIIMNYFIYIVILYELNHSLSTFTHLHHHRVTKLYILKASVLFLKQNVPYHINSTQKIFILLFFLSGTLWQGYLPEKLC